jgi:prepilin-type N-terminal cleavage/methylation domain-containing protein
MKKTLRKNKKGFTLIELIIVIAILAILAAIAIPNFIGLTDQARDAKAVGNANAIVTAINANNSMPSDASDIITSADLASFAANAATKAGSLWPVGLTNDDIDAALPKIQLSTGTVPVASLKTTSSGN